MTPSAISNTSAISFKRLAENNPDAELEIVAMEKRGKDKFLLRAATAPDADHSQLNAEYFTTYNEIKALAEAEVQGLLAEKDSRISSLENMVETALQRPSFYAQSFHNQGDTNMTGDHIIYTGRDYRETNVSDQATYTEGDYYNNPVQKQTLAEAATEIQQLLEQLDKSYATDTVAGQMQVAKEAMKRIESDMPFADRVLSAVRAGGTQALKQTLNHPAATFVLALLEDWQKTKEKTS